MKKFIFLLSASFLLTACSSSEKKQDQSVDFSENQPAEEYPKMIGERIDGPANIRDTINGKVILSLDDHILVETAPENDNWYLIHIHIALTEDQVKNSRIYPGKALFSMDGQKIGTAQDTVNFWVMNENTGLIEAYTHKDNIKKQSIPEMVLEAEIMKGNLNSGSLKDLLRSFNFEEYNEPNSLGYKQKYIYESAVLDPSPRDRITLLFDKKNELIGVFHSRKLNLKNYDTYKLIRGHSLTVIAELDINEIDRIIAERISFYNSVD